MAQGASTAGVPVVLVADDEQIMRELVATLLEADGCRVLQAETGAQAIALVDEHGGEIDLLIADMMMPEMTGPEAVARIRERHPGIAVLFLTGRDPDEVRDAGVGDAELLGKPFEMMDLRRKVRKLLDRSPTE